MCQTLILNNKEISTLGQLIEELSKRYPDVSKSELLYNVLEARHVYDGSDWELENPNTCLCNINNLSVARNLDCKILVDYSTDRHVLYPIDEGPE